MKTFSRLVTLGAVVSGAGGVVLAVLAPDASASPSVSASNTLITAPGGVSISAHVDPLNTAQLLFNGVPVASVKNPVNFGSTMTYTVNAASLGNGTYPVEEIEKTVGLVTQTARTTVTVRIPTSSPQAKSGGSGGSSGSGGSAAHSGVVSGGSTSSGGGGGGGGGGSSAAAGASTAAPAAIGYSGPSSGGTGFGSAYSRMDALSGSSALVLPDVAKPNGFQLPIKPAKHARLAGSPSRVTSLTAATWLIGLALALIMVLTAIHTSRWARKRRVGMASGTAEGGSAGGATAGGGTASATGSGGTATGATRRAVASNGGGSARAASATTARAATATATIATVPSVDPAGRQRPRHRR